MNFPMTIQEHIKGCCDEIRLVFNEASDVLKVSPGVYLFQAYCKDSQRIHRYKCVDTDGKCMIELY